MEINQYGEFILDSEDVFDLYMQNPDGPACRVWLQEKLEIHDDLDLDLSEFRVYQDPRLDLHSYDQQKQSRWLMPEHYVSFPIAEYLLDQCKSEAELQRVGEELLMFAERDMLMLLRYMKYLVDVMTENQIVWGVGRGSSVASYCLYLLGVHRINSLYYDLDIREFLK